MVNHILNYLEGSEGQKWALVGKGPSFDPHTVATLKKDGFNLCSINGAYSQCDSTFDLCIFVDWPVVFELKAPEQVTAYATASEKHPWVDNYYKSLPGLIPLMRKMAKLPNLHAFDVLGSEVYPDHPGIFVNVSTVEAAFDILCRSGVKDFAFVGIDGGKGYHSTFDKERPNPNNLTGQFQGLARLARLHKVTNLQGLPNEVLERFFNSSKGQSQ